MNLNRTAAPSDTIDCRQRALLMTVRQALIMILGALEDYLEIERTIVPRRKR
jgi:hypothetical protein